MILKYGGRRCRAGHRGCLEAYVNVAGLVDSAKKAIIKRRNSILKTNIGSLTPPDVFQAFINKDAAAIEAVSENAAMVGVAIGSVVNLLNPEVVVIGGGLSQGGAEYIKLIRKHVMAYAFKSATSALKIRIAKFGNDAGWIGAACLNIPHRK
jgi:glucokinase